MSESSPVPIPDEATVNISTNHEVNEQDTALPTISYGDFRETNQALTELEPGTTITGIPTLADASEIINAARSKIIFSRPDGDILQWRGQQLTTPEQFIQKYFKEKRFNGRVKGVSLTTLPLDLSAVNKPEERIRKDESFSFLMDLTLASSGRSPGNLAIQSTYAGIDSDTFHYNSWKHKVLAGETGVDILNKLLEDSKIGWAEAKRQALTRIVNAGAFGQGKRS